MAGNILIGNIDEELKDIATVMSSVGHILSSHAVAWADRERLKSRFVVLEESRVMSRVALG